ncbi:MAG TPA: alpha/beta hydrolase [Burkholderiales bacterium]|nr:alpha/beta hydrolase [Burkholderiales bacterium]
MRRFLRWGLYATFAMLALVALILAFFRWQAAEREVVTAQDGAPGTGRYVTAGDVAMFVQEAGPTDGTPVVLVHGTGAWSETWRESLTTLARAGYRAIAIDLPPFGYSQRPAQPLYGKHEQGRRIVGALDALGISGAVLVGHSFGGGPTVEAALVAPERVQGLVLVDAALGILPEGGQYEPPSPLLRAVLGVEPLRDAVVATFLTNPRFTRNLLQAFIHDPARATDARVAIYRQPLAVKGSTKAIGEWLPALLAPAGPAASENPASYRKLGMPVLVIWGDRDTITPLAQGKRLAAITPGAELMVMAGVGHIPQIEDPAGFNELLLKGVNRLK